MNTGYRDFCRKYKEKLKRDLEIKIPNSDNLRIKFIFNIEIVEKFPVAVFYPPDKKYLFTLDDEDLVYLYNKYSKLIRDELEENIKKIKEEYKDVIDVSY